MRKVTIILTPKNFLNITIRTLLIFAKSLEGGVPVAILDNTNIKKWNYERYTKAAEEAGYKVKIIEMPFPDPQTASERNEHKVSKEVIEK